MANSDLTKSTASHMNQNKSKSEVHHVSQVSQAFQVPGKLLPKLHVTHRSKVQKATQKAQATCEQHPGGGHVFTLLLRAYQRVTCQANPESATLNLNQPPHSKPQALSPKP